MTNGCFLNGNENIPNGNLTIRSAILYTWNTYLTDFTIDGEIAIYSHVTLIVKPQWDQ